MWYWIPDLNVLAVLHPRLKRCWNYSTRVECPTWRIMVCSLRFCFSFLGLLVAQFLIKSLCLHSDCNLPLSSLWYLCLFLSPTTYLSLSSQPELGCKAILLLLRKYQHGVREPSALSAAHLYEPRWNYIPPAHSDDRDKWRCDSHTAVWQQGQIKNILFLKEAPLEI